MKPQVPFLAPGVTLQPQTNRKQRLEMCARRGYGGRLASPSSSRGLADFPLKDQRVWIVSTASCWPLPTTRSAWSRGSSADVSRRPAVFLNRLWALKQVLWGTWS